MTGILVSLHQRSNGNFVLPNSKESRFVARPHRRGRLGMTDQPQMPTSCGHRAQMLRPYDDGGARLCGGLRKGRR
jgi:hypothetical protein